MPANPPSTEKRKCPRCHKERPLTQFKRTKSTFHPGHRSLFCTECLERMTRPEDLDQIDRLCQYLDLPFDPDLWTRLYAANGPHTLAAYFDMIEDDHYAAARWADESEHWAALREKGRTLSIFSEDARQDLIKRWSAEYSDEELAYLENFYNQICATQNVSTPILEEFARDLCEIELRIKKGLRGGADIKKDMDARDNIIKVAHFEANNSRSVMDFETIGELATYLVKSGWHPNWHDEPRDSVDFCMNNIQTYLQRLVKSIGNFDEQVEDRRRIFETTARLEDEATDGAANDSFDELPTEYEDEDDLARELGVWEL